MAYSNRAPKWITIVVALVFSALGVLMTFLGFLNETIGVACYVISSLILLLGIFLKRL